MTPVKSELNSAASSHPEQSPAPATQFSSDSACLKLPHHVLIVMLLLVLPGLLAAIWACRIRFVAEAGDIFVETALDFEEVRRFTSENGRDLPDFLSAASKAGISSIGIPEDTIQSLATEGRIGVFLPEDIARFGTTHIEPEAARAAMVAGAGGMLIHTAEDGLLERMERHIGLKRPDILIERPAPGWLMIHGSAPDLREHVGVGFTRSRFELVQKLGFGLIIRPRNNPRLASEAIRAIFDEMPPPSSISAIIFAEEDVIGAHGDILAAATNLREKSKGGIPYRIGQVEFLDQTGLPQLIGFLGGALPIVRVHSIGRREMEENYDVSRAVARWTRAVRERRLKLLYIRLFFQDLKSVLGNPAQTNLSYIRDIVSHLESSGFKIPRNDKERRLEPRYAVGHLPGPIRFLIGLSLLMGISILTGISRKRQIDLHLIAGTTCLAAVLFLAVPSGVFQAATGLAGAISYSTIGCIWAIRRLEEPEAIATAGISSDTSCQSASVRSFPGFSETTAFFSRLVAPSLVGGILIAGIHSESEYLLHFEQFRGIKAAFLVPLLWVGVWSLRRYGAGFLSLFSKPLTGRDLLLGLLVLGGTALYLLRSGNVTFMKPSAGEDLVRTWLEELLVARPRNKEFLIGYPAVFFFLFFYSRRIREILPLLACAIVMGQVSVVNTFCHFHSPLLLAFLRGWNGLWVGISVGAITLVSYLFCRIIASVGGKHNGGVVIGYFGFGNLGDELLCRAFLEEAHLVCPDITWRVLVKYENLHVFKSSCGKAGNLISRAALGELCEALASARVVVIPGGGVLQAVTSERSLWYYLVLIGFARLCGARLLLPAQGLGPWKRHSPRLFSSENNSSDSSLNDRPSFLVGWALHFLLADADHLSLRDVASAEALSRLPGAPVSAKITADPAFLLSWNKSTRPGVSKENDSPSDKAESFENSGINAQSKLSSDAPDAQQPLSEKERYHFTQSGVSIAQKRRIGVILRSSVRMSEAIAKTVLELMRISGSTIDIVPLAFQPVEDEDIWYKVSESGTGIPSVDKSAEKEKKANGVVIVPRLLRSFEDAQDALSNLDILISMRLHGCILATAKGIPWIGLSYDPKVASFASAIGRTQVIAPEKFNAAEFSDMLHALIIEHAHDATHLRDVASKLRDIAKADLDTALARA
ncbi:MAG: polysaccharide pyruvyl transferase family protein [Candidatus Riflebacteria bacterium]|nr:polysaccharide pyruvyl transferase family protein [Candidatus Riflebacteria bacterium]